jgi:hypothetical protein
MTSSPVDRSTAVRSEIESGLRRHRLTRLRIDDPAVPLDIDLL